MEILVNVVFHFVICVSLHSIHATKQKKQVALKFNSNKIKYSFLLELKMYNKKIIFISSFTNLSKTLEYYSIIELHVPVNVRYLM